MKSENEPTKVIIVDDEALARERIRNLLLDRDDIEIAAECSNGPDAVAKIRSENPDLIFLDIQMKGMDGFEVLGNLEDGCEPRVVFVTAFDQYAVRAFEVYAVDYLLKPFDTQRFHKTLDRVQEELRRDELRDINSTVRRLTTDFQALSKDVRARESSREGVDEYIDRLAIRSVGSISFVEVSDIEWIAAEGSYVRLNGKGKSTLMRESLRKLERVLDPSVFLRIHRSTIVNIQAIAELNPQFHGEYRVILKNGRRLVMSRKYREIVRSRLLGNL